MQRTAIISIAVAGMVLVAGLTLGWHSYLVNPEGLFLYTPSNWCAARSHSFTSAFLLALMVGFALLAGVAALTFIAGLLASMASRKAALHSAAKVSALSMLFIALGALLHIPIEAKLPLRKIPACVQNST